MKAVKALLVILLLLISPAFANVEVNVQRDGYLQVKHSLQVVKGLPIAIDLLGDPEELLVLESGNPAYYTVKGNELLVYPTINGSLLVTYYTSTPTYKAGPLWFLLLNLSEPALIELPEGAALVGINNVPEKILSVKDRLEMELGPGEWNVTYVIPPQTTSPVNPMSMYLLLIAILVTLSVFLIFKRKKGIHIEKLREDDKRILEFLKSKGGQAYSSDIQKALGLPKTTTWRAIRRLERAGMVMIEKDEYGRNLVKLRS